MCDGGELPIQHVALLEQLTPLPHCSLWRWQLLAKLTLVQGVYATAERTIQPETISVLHWCTKSVGVTVLWWVVTNQRRETINNKNIISSKCLVLSWCLNLSRIICFGIITLIVGLTLIIWIVLCLIHITHIFIYHVLFLFYLPFFNFHLSPSQFSLHL